MTTPQGSGQMPTYLGMTSFPAAARIAEDEPELLRELRLIVDKHSAAATPAFLSRARHVLAEK